MDLHKLEELSECNELDVLYKIIDIAQDIRPRVEKVLHNNREAGVDVRKAMQDIRILATIMRDQVQIRYKEKRGREQKQESALYKAIMAEKNRIKKLDEKIERLEEKRKKNL